MSSVEYVFTDHVDHAVTSPRLTVDEARRVAANIARLPMLLAKKD
jgi:hypothetical protein